MAIPIYLGEPVTHSQEELAEKALDFVKSIKPKEYRRMKKEGTLTEYCARKARAARDYAENLMATGEPAKIAWNRAIRLEILESETD